LKVWVIELTGCEWGGIAKEAGAFKSREDAQAWIDKQPKEPSIDFREAVELEVAE